MDDLEPRDATSDARSASRHAWATTTVVLLWLGLHVAGLIAGGGRLSSDHVFTWAGVPQEQLLRHGALVPARVTAGEWQRLLTGSAVVGQGALSLLLALWVFVGSARSLERLAGTSRAWIVMIVAALAGALTRVAWVPDSRLVHMAGWDLILGVVGARIPLGLALGGPQGRTLVSSAFAFLALSALLAYAMPGTPTSHYLGEGVGFVVGALTLTLLGPRRLLRPPGPPTRGVALLCLALLLGAAGWQVKTTLSGIDDAAVRRVLKAVASADLAGQRHAKNPSADSLETLRARLESARAAADLRGLDGASELDAYLDLLESLLSAERRDAIALHGRLRAAYEAWAPFENRLARSSGADGEHGESVSRRAARGFESQLAGIRDRLRRPRRIAARRGPRESRRAADDDQERVWPRRRRFDR